MKITSKILHLPPYISLSWHEVKAIFTEGEALSVLLNDGGRVLVPDLDKETLEKVFKAHAQFLEFKGVAEPRMQSVAFPFRMGPANLEGVGNAMQHNPEQRHAPDLPKEVLEKIASIVKIVSPAEGAEAPEAEPHCNCPHCQIARAIKGSSEDDKALDHQKDSEEEVSDEELKFSQWEIVEAGEQLYTVVNKLDRDERYSVYLGNPVGCTCGREGCEHIVAVLES